jgi:hypothetical protein
MNASPVLVFAEFPKPEDDPFKINIWAEIIYIPEIDSYGTTYMNSKRVMHYADKPFDNLTDAMTEIEQLLFEEGVREDA